MPQFLKTLTFSQFMNVCGLGILTFLFVNNNVSATEFFGAAGLLIGLPINTSDNINKTPTVNG